MTLKDLIETLQEKLEEHGDVDVFVDADANGLRFIGEIDIDSEENGLVIWLEAL